jgi:hypothetical protein
MKLSFKNIIYIGFFLRVLIAIWNGVFGPSFGADLDAAGLNGFASDVATSGVFQDFKIGYAPYVNILGFIYTYTFNHLFLGSFISCLAWLTSSYYLYKSSVILKLSKNNNKILFFLYSILPTSLLLTSVTLREPYQLLFTNLTIFGLLAVIFTRTYSAWIYIIIGCIGASSLHGAMLGFSIFAISTTIFFNSFYHMKVNFIKLTFIVGLVLIIAYFGISLLDNASYKLDDGLIVAAQNYQEGGIDAGGRTNYKESAIGNSNASDLILFIPISLFQYLFEPMPWKIGSLTDIPIFIENLFRAYFLYISFKFYRKSNSHDKKQLGILFMLYIVGETIWALGTINWGTSSRHHIPSMGILLLMVFKAKSITLIKFQK